MTVFFPGSKNEVDPILQEYLPEAETGPASMWTGEETVLCSSEGYICLLCQDLHEENRNVGKKTADTLDQVETQVLIEGMDTSIHLTHHSPSFLQMKNIIRYQSLAPAVVAAIAGSGTGWKMFWWVPRVGGGRLGEMLRSVLLDLLVS